MRNKARELEDFAWATHFASQAPSKEFKKFVRDRTEPILNRNGEQNDVQRAIRELGG